MYLDFIFINQIFLRKQKMVNTRFYRFTFEFKNKHLKFNS